LLTYHTLDPNPDLWHAGIMAKRPKRPYDPEREAMIDEVIKEMLASIRVASARNRMRATKIRTGPDADAPLPPLAERMRLHALAKKGLTPPPRTDHLTPPRRPALTVVPKA
jgi:hypothetical protein